MRYKKAKFGKILKIKSLSYFLDRMISAKTISCYCPFNYVINYFLLIPGGMGNGENGGGQAGGGGGQQGPAQEECQEGCKPAGQSRRLQQPRQGPNF